VGEASDAIDAVEHIDASKTANARTNQILLYERPPVYFRSLCNRLHEQKGGSVKKAIVILVIIVIVIVILSRLRSRRRPRL
jgi:hypothetical protein